MTILVLTPTSLELDAIKPRLARSVRQADGFMELCGFGPIASAARTMQLIAINQPRRVILVGIAGSLRPELEVGTAQSFRRVTCDGIGAGTGADYKSAGQIGWLHWRHAASASDKVSSGIGDTIFLQPRHLEVLAAGRDLLTVCAASANESDAARRCARYPDAFAEDMEGFGVAAACSLSGTSLEIIRGISNRAGDRDKNNWDIDAALHAASELTLRALSA